LAAQMEPIVSTAPDPISTQEPKSDWKVAAGIGACLLAVGLGVLAALGGVVRGSDTYNPGQCIMKERPD